MAKDETQKPFTSEPHAEEQQKANEVPVFGTYGPKHGHHRNRDGTQPYSRSGLLQDAPRFSVPLLTSVVGDACTDHHFGSAHGGGHQAVCAGLFLWRVRH